MDRVSGQLRLLHLARGMCYECYSLISLNPADRSMHLSLHDARCSAADWDPRVSIADKGIELRRAPLRLALRDPHRVRPPRRRFRCTWGLHGRKKRSGGEAACSAAGHHDILPRRTEDDAALCPDSESGGKDGSHFSTPRDSEHRSAIISIAPHAICLTPLASHHHPFTQHPCVLYENAARRRFLCCPLCRPHCLHLLVIARTACFTLKGTHHDHLSPCNRELRRCQQFPAFHLKLLAAR